MTTTETTKTYDVGGVELDRPFKIRRLGHFGLDVEDTEESVRFYNELLGFQISDVYDFGTLASDRSVLEGKGSTAGYFMRHGSDHHSFLLLPRPVLRAVNPERWQYQKGTINQITWQVGGLREVADAAEFMPDQDVRVYRVGRDMPGSNWHVYIADPDGHTNEIYYGIEQVGWTGASKPFTMEGRRLQAIPPLPLPPEYAEVDEAMAAEVDIHAGYRSAEKAPATYDVDGILLPRPFKITRIGPVGLFVSDVETVTAFYRDVLGFELTETVIWQGHTCAFLRCNTEHHSLALYPLALRSVLGQSEFTTVMSFGLQMGTYRQLRDALAFLRSHGATVVEVPPELHPGIEHAAYVEDPDGHRLQLYFAMEQIGWDGRPRSADARQLGPADDSAWPETLPATSDVYRGETFMGPLG